MPLVREPRDCGCLAEPARQNHRHMLVDAVEMLKCFLALHQRHGKVQQDKVNIGVMSQEQIHAFFPTLGEQDSVAAFLQRDSRKIPHR